MKEKTDCQSSAAFVPAASTHQEQDNLLLEIRYQRPLLMPTHFDRSRLKHNQHPLQAQLIQRTQSTNDKEEEEDDVECAKQQLPSDSVFARRLLISRVHCLFAVLLTKPTCRFWWPANKCQLICCSLLFLSLEEWKKRKSSEQAVNIRVSFSAANSHCSPDHNHYHLACLPSLLAALVVFGANNCSSTIRDCGSNRKLTFVEQEKRWLWLNWQSKLMLVLFSNWRPNADLFASSTNALVRVSHSTCAHRITSHENSSFICSHTQQQHKQRASCGSFSLKTHSSHLRSAHLIRPLM